MPTWLGSNEGPIPALQTTAFLPCPYMAFLPGAVGQEGAQGHTDLGANSSLGLGAPIMPQQSLGGPVTTDGRADPLRPTGPPADFMIF